MKIHVLHRKKNTLLSDPTQNAENSQWISEKSVKDKTKLIRWSNRQGKILGRMGARRRLNKSKTTVEGHYVKRLNVFHQFKVFSQNKKKSVQLKKKTPKHKTTKKRKAIWNKIVFFQSGVYVWEANGRKHERWQVKQKATVRKADTKHAICLRY